jgi:hypothetical protein
MLGKLLCLFGFHVKKKRRYDSGAYGYRVSRLECERPGCKWATPYEPY